MSRTQTHWINLVGWRDLGDKRNFITGKGCDTCNAMDGVQGRKGIYELMRISDPLRELINERLCTVTLKQKAIKLGMDRAASGRIAQRFRRRHYGGGSAQVHLIISNLTRLLTDLSGN